MSPNVYKRKSLANFFSDHTIVPFIVLAIS
jgi:hypothetical protein